MYKQKDRHKQHKQHRQVSLCWAILIVLILCNAACAWGAQESALPGAEIHTEGEAAVFGAGEFALPVDGDTSFADDWSVDDQISADADASSDEDILADESALPDEDAFADDELPLEEEVFAAEEAESALDDPFAELIEDPDGQGEEEDFELLFFDGELAVEDVEESIVIDDPIVTDPTTQTTSAASGRRLLRAASAASATIFTSYYDQLEDEAKVFYEARKSWFADQRQTGKLELDYDETTRPYTFPCSIVQTTNASGKTVWSLDRTSDLYKEGHENLLYLLRASFDAFYYDHPEVFWTRSTSVVISYGSISGSVNSQARTAILYPKKITISPVEAFAGASSLIKEFDIGVQDAIEEIRESSDYDGNGMTDQTELLQGIHDYICRTCYYDKDGLDTYKTTLDYRIFTPAGVFVEGAGRGIVCEGYSRAFKILCDRFGFTCAMVSGKAYAGATIGHQWNAVFVDNEWFIVDVTWDDTNLVTENDPVGIKYQYYLCYAITGRIESGKIGGADKVDSKTGWTTRTKEFTFPAVSAGGTHTFDESGYTPTIISYACTSVKVYQCDEHPSVRYYIGKAAAEHVWDEGEIIREASCTLSGIKKYVCRNASSHIYREIIPSLGHQYGVPTYTWSEDHASVTATAVCERDPSHIVSETVGTTGNVKTEPTCETAGIRVYTSDAYDNELFAVQTEEVAIPALGHDWSAWTVTKSPTTTAEGVVSRSCTRCGKTETRAVEKLEKKAQPMTAKGKTVSVKGSKKQTISQAKAITVKSAQGKVTYKKVSGNKKITVSSKTGKITVKKGLKKGTYKVVIEVTAAGNDQYKAGSKKVTVRIKIK